MNVPNDAVQNGLRQTLRAESGACRGPPRETDGCTMSGGVLGMGPRGGDGGGWPFVMCAVTKSSFSCVQLAKKTEHRMHERRGRKHR